MPPSVKIAFFDLDKTILAVSSAPLVFRRLRKTGMIGPLASARIVWTMMLYAVGLGGADDLIRTGSAMTKGYTEDDLMQWYTALWNEEVRTTIRPGARKVVEEYRSRGAKNVLITSSTPFIARLAMTELGLDEALAPLITKDASGRFTGDCEEPLCTGHGKIFHALNTARAHGVSLEQCAFYSDSYSDLPLLEAVGHPFVIDPDPRLKRLAAQRSWPVLTW